VGIVSDRDLKLACDMDTRQGESLKISDVCSPDVYTVTSSESVKSVAAHMAEMGIGSAVIVDDREKVIGIFTVTDACRLLAESL
jgi:CBS domain-containing protein